MTVPEVGIRELRDNLSKYVNEVRQGAELTVTDHGKAVARLLPFDQPRKLDQLIADGLVTRAASATRALPKRRAAAGGTVSDLAGDQSE